MKTNTDNRQLWFLAASAAALIAVAGCSDDLLITSQLERTRVVGARVVTADPGRADVAPGEAASVEWIVLGPQAPATLDWAFAQCTTLAGNCVDAVTPVGEGSGTPVSVPFTTPAADALTGGRVPTMMGAVCADGTLGLDPATQLPSCTGNDASGTIARYVIPFIAGDAAPNHHPNLANDRLDVGGVEWTTPVAGDSGAPCDGSDGTPVVTARPDDDDDAKVELRLTTDEDDRETYTAAPMDGTTPTPTLEELQISLFATAGKFESSYLAIFKDDTRPNADVTVKWKPPKAADVPAGGMTVQFHFVMRDGRGGLDLTHRTLCMVAP
jgi:hypothetical protein